MRGNKKSSLSRRRASYRRGLRAEFWASLFLMLKGYSIVSRRFKTPVGEIDLIARKGTVIAFVEVKARSSVELALDSVSYSSRSRIESAGDWWISRQKDGNLLSWRFDIIAIVPFRLPVHFKDVW